MYSYVFVSINNKYMPYLMLENIFLTKVEIYLILCKLIVAVCISKPKLEVQNGYFTIIHCFYGLSTSNRFADKNPSLFKR